jgi:serine phosphatase RsbU (regulator of sigma subunit)
MKHKNKIILLFLFYSIFSLSIFSQNSNDKKANAQTISKIKTAFIYNFTKYVFWPREDNIDEFKICVMSSEELAQNLNSLANIKKFRDRIPIKVIFCKTIDEIEPCQMLIIDGNTTQNLWKIYSKIRGKSVLMVAENLVDYKKSIISFTELNGHMKYIINKTKMEESNLVVNQLLYTLAITKDDDWKNIFEKFKSFMQSSDKEVKLDKSDVAQMLSSYKSLEEEKKSKENVINEMEDVLRRKTELFRLNVIEYKKIGLKIAQQKKTLSAQQLLMSKQMEEISYQESKIGKQKTVIAIIALLSFSAILLLFFTIRTNNQRKKANQLLSEQKKEIENQKHLVDEKQKEILDSIKYAKRIQTALLANDKLLSDNLPEHFVLFKPKDIVAGDFYWATKLNGSFVYVTGDCTGHGVPGAFMSLLNISKLNETINQKHITRPDLILNDVKKDIIHSLNPEGSSEESKDGMDAIVCQLDFNKMKLHYAAANNSFFIVRNNELLSCKADKMPVGKSHNDNDSFTYNEIDLQKGDMIYTCTDGFGDQFGGPKGKKFKLRQLKEIIVKISQLAIHEQKNMLNKCFEDWRGELEQVDDVLVIGVRV